MRSELRGVLCALPSEAPALSRSVAARGEIRRIGPNLLCLVAGMGGCNASEGVTKLIEAGAAGVISWGFAGALSAELRPGTLVLPLKVSDGRSGLDVDPGLWRVIRDAIPESLSPCTGELVSVKEIVRTAAAKRRLHETGGAVAVDMESASVVRAARELGKPAVVVRAIVDTVTLTIPDYVNDEGTLADIATGLARRPGSIVALARLALAYRRARATLSAVGSMLEA